VRPPRADIAVLPFPAGVAWVGGTPPAVERICARGPLLVHFIDFAQLNSVRTLPYLVAWHERYAAHGLTVLGVNSPRWPFTRKPEALALGLGRLGVGFPVAADGDHAIWHAYGCDRWPSLFLWGRGGALAWYHFGEGEYRATEEAIQAELAASGSLPEPLAPLRASDAPGALVAPPSEEVFPGGSLERPWTPEASPAPLELAYEAGGAHATVDGEGSLEVSLDGGEPRTIAVGAPGLYDLAAHPRHERHRIALRPSAGMRVWSVSFSPGVVS